MLPFLKAEYLQKLIGILLHRHSSLLLHLLFYSIIISISMDSWIFILHPELQPTTTLNIFSYFKYYSTSGHWEIFQLVPLCPFHIFLLMQGFVLVWFRALPYFLTLHDAPGSACTLPVLALESATSPRSLGFFHWRVVLETKISV